MFKIEIFKNLQELSIRDNSSFWAQTSHQEFLRIKLISDIVRGNFSVLMRIGKA